ncbi:MAG: precorrin-6A reductase [Anaerovoracaceae bacterium]
MCKVILFGGTTEGRLLAQFLDENRIDSVVCVATEYGGSLVRGCSYVKVIEERLDETEMEELINSEKPQLVIDATHPFAKIVTENILRASENTETEYMRVVRDSDGASSDEAVYVDTVDDAVAWLKDNTEGKILATTGSKELAKYTEIPDYQSRVYARVLSTAESVMKAAELGFEGANLIAMQGPFSREMNKALLTDCGIRYLVTKESGNTGGYADKLEACRECGVTPVIIGRPAAEKGETLASAKGLIAEKFAFDPVRQISLIGIGMGNVDGMTKEALEALDEAELVIGSGRMLKPSLSRYRNKPVFDEYNSDKIAAFINENKGYTKIAVLLSGDTGFYSGAKKLIGALSGEKRHIEVLPGISSLAYFAAKIQKSWDDCVIVSNHGRKASLIPLIRDNEKVFSILGKADDIMTLAGKLVEYGMNDVTMYIGENLSYDNERILQGRPEQFIGTATEPLAVVMVENHAAGETKLNPLTNRGDGEFIRGQVPMTKEEIRILSVSKLNLKSDSICYDVGAGTGSVSVEMAVKVPQGQIYAIEKNEEAVKLLKNNKKKFMADNLEIVEGLAPEALRELPAPTHVFIGGSSGNMDQIISEILEKSEEHVRFVINCIAMESAAQALECAKRYGISEPDISQISVSRGHAVGRYTMMKSENPITIICFDGEGKKC